MALYIEYMTLRMALPGVLYKLAFGINVQDMHSLQDILPGVVHACAVCSAGRTIEFICIHTSALGRGSNCNSSQ